mmetsp:Transcript_12517/g.24012  ORF Transcript_12517/g.24012 Transcript_12517/m.24012 type:complete len:414 (+) Transcript_12517:158-1399(+)
MKLSLCTPLFFPLVVLTCLGLAFTSRVVDAFVTRSTTILNRPSSMELYHNKKNGGKGVAKGFGDSSTSSSKRTRAAPLKLDRFPYAGTIRPGKQSPQKKVTDKNILKPDYAESGIPQRVDKPMFPWMIEVKSAEDIEKMRAAGSLARDILDLAGRAVEVGVTTDEIDNLVHSEIIKRGAYPSPLNYHGFPKSCCTSVNEVICHGIPDDRKLENGDIINLDITVYLDGYHGDCSEMFVAGEVDEDGKKLLQATYDSWISACNIVKPGVDYKEIGGVIEDYVTPLGYSSVRNFCGHGIGKTFHTNPNVLHYRNSEPNGQMAAGHTFTIEPMICEQSAKALTWPDEWTATTVDGKRTAQFEHTLLITDEGVEALTGKKETSPVQFWERESKVHQGIWLGTTPAAKRRMEEINALAA